MKVQDHTGRSGARLSAGTNNEPLRLQPVMTGVRDRSGTVWSC